ncbi:hypothetical protein GQ457_13G014220 [Hibiscus cannabinus]
MTRYCSIGAVEDKLKKMTKDAPVPAYTWTFEPAVSSREGTPMVAETLQHSGAKNRQNSIKDKNATPTLHVNHWSQLSISCKRIFISGHQIATAFLGALEEKTRKRKELKIFCSPHVTPHQLAVPLM